MTLLRRFVVIQAFLLWQGGFLFYTAVVVPVGTEVLQSAKDQGFITHQVTNWMNAFGGIWAAVFLWELLQQTGSRGRWIGWILEVVGLVALVLLHREMDTFLDVEQFRVSDRGTFRLTHRVYLWISTVQWLIGLVLVWMTLRSWATQRGSDKNLDGINRMHRG